MSMLKLVVRGDNMVCKIQKDGLKTYFDIDGKKVFPSAYMSYNLIKDNIDDFKNIGVNVFMFPVYAGDEGINMESGLKPFYKNFFKGYGKYDFSVVEEILEKISSVEDEEVYIIPRVCLEPPIWWQKENINEVARDYRGEVLRECYASQKWRNDMSVALKALIDYFDNSKWKDKIIGIHIAAGGTEEWPYQCRYDNQYYDYSEPNRKAYVKWLRQKYVTDESISKAWGQEIKDFNDIQFPKPVERTYAKHGFLRNESEEKHVLDFFDFHNWIVADTINYFCKEVKEYTDYSKITGVFYGYVVTMPHNKKGLHALEEVLKCPYVDFVSTTNDGQEPGKSWIFSSAVKSALFHDKMWIAEGDLRTYLTRGLDVSMPHAVPNNDYYSSGVWKGPEGTMLSESVTKKALSRVLTSNAGIWWFDMFGGWLKDERLLEIISKTSNLLKSQNKSYLKADVAYIINEKGYKYYGIDEKVMTQAVRETCHSIGSAGFMYDIYLLSDIKNNNFPADDYKLYIFLGGPDACEEDKKAIKEKLQNKNKTLLWLHSAFAFDSSVTTFNLNLEGEKFKKATYKGISYPENEIEILDFKEKEGFVLSRFEDSNEPAVLWKDMGEWSSVYSLSMAPHCHLFREIALMSGVHLYNLSDDCIYAGGEFVALHAKEGGYKRINLPDSDFKAENALTGEAVEVNDMFIDIKMEKYDTEIFHIYK